MEVTPDMAANVQVRIMMVDTEGSASSLIRMKRVCGCARLESKANGQEEVLNMRPGDAANHVANALA
jgi:hypothetical protein